MPGWVSDCLKVSGKYRQQTNLPTFCLTVPGQCKELTLTLWLSESFWIVERLDQLAI